MNGHKGGAMKQSKTDNKNRQAPPSGKEEVKLEPKPKNAETYYIWGILALLLLWAIMILWTLKGH
jgi:hypothetical protein